MNDASAQLFALLLAALWCGFGLYGLARLAAHSPQGRELLDRLRRSGPLGQAAALALLVTVVAIGGTKPGDGNGGGNGGGLRSGPSAPEGPPPEPALGLVEVRTNAVALLAESASAVEVEDWRRHGSATGGVWLEFDEPFFRIGTNPVSRAYVAANGTISFESMRRPRVGFALPDAAARPEGSPRLGPALAPLLAPLGMVPEANWGGASRPVEPLRSRFWHDAVPGRGRVFTWENALLDRLPGRRVSVQAELLPSGDFTCRYDFADALDPPATNLVLGAQVGTNGVNALAILGTNLLAETVWRVDGARVTNGVSVADLLCTNGILRAPARFALEWKNTTGLDPNADADGDGLSDWDEVFRYGTDPNHADTDGDGLSDGAETLAGGNPLDADENNDGIPDGVDQTAWEGDPIWADNAGKTNLVVTLGTAVPDGAAASLVLGSVTIPLRGARQYVFGIPGGVEVPFRLFSRGVGAVDLSMSNMLSGQQPPNLRSSPNRPQKEFNGPCLRLHDLLGVFDGNQANGEGFVAEPHIYLRCESGDDDMVGSCIHGDGFCVYSIVTEPASCSFELHEADEIDGFQIQQGKFVSLHVTDAPGDSDYGSIRFGPKYHCWGDADIYHGIHRCEGGRLVWCSACDMYHDTNGDHPCAHEDGCPSRTNAAASCTCPIPVIRVNGAGTSLSENAKVHFPEGGMCCCAGDLIAPFARIKRIDSNLHITNATGTANATDVVSGPATVYAHALSGTKPSEVEYEIVHRHYDGSGAVTNEVSTNATLKVWAVDIRHEPVTADTVGGLSVNPSGIVLGQTARFRIAIAPTNFPSSLVSWEASPANLISFPAGTNGTEVVVQGDATGDVTLTVRIAGYAGPPPICEAKVVAETVVPVHAYIICDSGYASTNLAGIHSIVDEVNDIYSQVGRRFNLVSVHSITNASWLDIQRIGGRWSPFSDIVNYTNATGGIEVYFVRSIAGANGLTTHAGVVVKGGIQPNTLAHELGHAQDLPDIYVDARSGVNSVTGLVYRARMPADWGSQVDEGYYRSNLQQSNLVQRLLMFGVGDSDKRDISNGDIQGIWRQPFTSGPYQDTLSPVGFFIHANSNPVSN